MLGKLIGREGFAAVVAAVGLLSCSSSPEPLGRATAAITQAPAGVSCIEITVTGNGPTVNSLFSVTPGEQTVLPLSGLPLGSDTFVGEAFAVACSAAGSSVPTWVSAPVTAVAALSPPVNVTLVFVRNAQGSVSVTFESDGGGCTAGAACTGATVCQIGTTSCSSGQSSCAVTGNAANGTACGSNEVCDNGACVACTAGAACSPGTPPNTCQTGTTSCSSGQSSCSATGNAANGTTCAGGNCCGGACTNTTNDNGACGASCRVCPSGSTCTNSACVVTFGITTESSPCGTAIGALGAGTLLGQLVSVSAPITLTGLGLFGNQPAAGVEGAMALYTNVGGAPSALVASTSVATIVAGNNRLSVTPSVAIAAGTYWIVAEYNAVASICTDSSTSNTLDFVSASFDALPSTFGTPKSAMGTADLDYYVIGTE